MSKLTRRTLPANEVIYVVAEMRDLVRDRTFCMKGLAGDGLASSLRLALNMANRFVSRRRQG